MKRIEIKPLSVNEAWKGKRYKTEKYKDYEKILFLLLPKKIDLPPPPYEIHFKFGFSSSLADYDNPVKILQDILSKKYGLIALYENILIILAFLSLTKNEI